MMSDLNSFVNRIENFDKLRSSEQIDFFAHFLIYELKQDVFTASQINNIFKILRLIPYSNVSKYLNESSNAAKSRKRKVKFIKSKHGFTFLSSFENELKLKIRNDDTSFFDFKINHDSIDIKPSEIPFLNSKIRKNADFFSKMYFLLYHFENSIRKLISNRMISIIGQDWEKHLLTTVDLNKAQIIRKETNLSEMIQDRGDSILYYCMWDDYGKIIKKFPNIISNPKECDELLAHLNTLSKIRNAIAHNTATIPNEYKDEMTFFLRKYIRMMKDYKI